MPDSSDSRTTGTPPAATGKETAGGPGIKFNHVGREEPAKEVLTPQIDPALRRRRIGFIFLALIALAVLIAVSLIRFGLSRPPDIRRTDDRPVRPPEPRFD